MKWEGAHGATGVFLVALVVRVAFSCFVPAAPVSADAADYDRLASAIVDGRGYVSAAGIPTSERPPLYSYFLAIFYANLDNGQSFARGVQSFLDAVTCSFVYVLALRHFGVVAARISALSAIFSLSLLFATRHLMTETLSTFFMVAVVLALDLTLSGWRRTGFFLTGALVGFSTLTKGTTLALPVALMLPILVATRWKWRPAIRGGLLLLLGFVLTLLPWTIRNHRVHGALVPVATQMGFVVYSSYVPPEGRILGVYTDDELATRTLRLPEVERSRVFLEAALGHVREHPLQLPRLLLLKFLYFVSPFDWELLGGDGVFNFTYALMAPLAMYGLWMARSNGWGPLLLAIPPGFLLALSLGVYGSPRLRLPCEPLLMVLAGSGLVMAWDRAERHKVAFTAVTAMSVLVGITAYVFSVEVKEVSAQLLRNLGIW